MRTHLLSVALLVAGCSNGPAPSEAPAEEVFGRFQPRSEEVLRVALPERVIDVDPLRATRPTDALVATQLFAGLTERDDARQGHRMALARAIDLDASKRSARISLHEGAKWSNGVPITADDVAWSVTNALRPSTEAEQIEPLLIVENARAFHQGTLLRVRGKEVSAARAPFIVFSDGAALEAYVPGAFRAGSVVVADDSDLRRAKADVELRVDPEARAAVAVVLPRDVVARVLSQKRSGGGDWVELRATAGGKSGWARESELEPAYPTVDERRVRGEREHRDAQKLFVQPNEESGVLAALEDDAPVEIIAWEKDWVRAIDRRTGKHGFMHASALEDVVGDRRYLHVRGTGEASGVAGWVPADALTLDDTLVGIRAIDKHTVEVKLAAPTPNLPALLATLPWRPRPRSVVERYGHRWSTPRFIQTSGAFRPTVWRPRDRIDLERSPTYARKSRVHLVRVELLVIEDPVAALHMYRGGFIDVMDGSRLPPALLIELQGALDWSAERRPGFVPGDPTLQEGADGEALLVMPEVSHLAASRDRIHAFESVRVMTTLAEDVDVDVSTDPDDDVDPDARLLQDDDGDESTQDATEAAP